MMNHRIDKFLPHAAAALAVWLLATPTLLQAEKPQAAPDPLAIVEALDRADAAWVELQSLLGQEAGDTEAIQPAAQQLDEALSLLRQQIGAAQEEATLAFVKLASHTAWLIHTESRKVPASRRLIQMTRTTGRTEEIERYQQRHQVLLANIDAAASQYQLSLSTLVRLDRHLVDRGFAQYEAQLVELGLVEQIRLNHLVREHLDEYARTAEPDLAKWRRELEQLLPADQRGEGAAQDGE